MTPSVELSVDNQSLNQREDIIDIIRGFAVFGILTVNILGFSSPAYTTVLINYWWTTPIDKFCYLFINFFAVGKFYSIFSFLFGLGFAIQLQRPNTSNNFITSYCWRLIILGCFGLSHLFFIWWGDIIHLYALLGFILLLFRDGTDRTIIIAAAVCLFVPIQLSLLESVIAIIDSTNISNDVTSPVAQLSTYQQLINESIRCYSQGSYREIFSQRWQELIFHYSCMLPVIPHIFAMFLFGFYAGKQGTFHHRQQLVDLAGRIIKPIGITALISNVIYLLINYRSQSFIVDIYTGINGLFYIVGATTGACFYIVLLILIANSSMQRFLLPLASVGRLALTNYLAQSLICTTIFYHYGFGLYGRIGAGDSLLLAVLIYIFQIGFSYWWLKYFRLGPMEWLWRVLRAERR